MANESVDMQKIIIVMDYEPSDLQDLSVPVSMSPAAALHHWIPAVNSWTEGTAPTSH